MSRPLGAYTVGIRLKQARDKRSLTRQQLGTLAGVGYTTISHIESGNVQPRIDTIVSLARALNVHPSWLAFGLGKPGDAPGQDDV